MKKRYKLISSVLVLIFSYYFTDYCLDNKLEELILCVPILLMLAGCLLIAPFADYVCEKIENLKK